MKPESNQKTRSRANATWRTFVIGVFLAAGVSADHGVSFGAARFKVFIEESGVYAVTYDDLVQAGLQLGPVASEGVGMTSRGERVPIWIEDGGDGVFGTGDRIVFVGRRLRGDYSYLDEYSRFNCYVLHLNAVDPLHGIEIGCSPFPSENSDGDCAVPDVDTSGFSIRSRKARVSAESYFPYVAQGNPMPDDEIAKKRRFRTGTSPGGAGPDQPADLFVRRRFEEDTLMVRYPERPNEPQERWYWSRLSVTDREPFRLSLTLDGIRQYRASDGGDAHGLRNLTVVGASGDDTREHLHEIFGIENSATVRVALRIGLRGWSKPRNAEGLAHHQVSIAANGREISSAEWNSTDPFTHHVEVPIDDADSNRLELEIRVSRRRLPETDDLFVDVVLLNWIEVEFLRDSGLREGQSRFEVRADTRGETPLVDIIAGGDGWLYGPGVGRAEIIDGPNRVEGRVLGEGPLFSVIGDAYRKADQIVPDIPSALKTTFRQTDYIMITHRRLLDAVQPLAEFHRRRGLSVAVVDVEDIYDEFNHGIQHPRSLRDFLKWAYDNWPDPRPRFVLLAGDASWDYKNLTADDARYADWTYRPGEARNFVKNDSSSYEDKADINHRNLVPTWGYRTSQGHAASDNWLVCVDGDDIYPDMAVGRIPVTEPDEMAAVIRKTIAYADREPAGSWRKNLLFITNESKGFQRASDATSEIFEKRGYDARKIYPSSEETANEEHTRNIVRAFDDGLLMVQFFGHGGRYIWRTGPPDLKKNHDLFTLEHLDMLAPTGKLPFVTSLTCYSAPFDHPSADSIGEKLLRLDGRGAIGVFAASWRNSPSSDMGRIVMNELSTPGATIGEAVMRAKRRLRSPTLIETYNLLGDPAISLNLAPDVMPPASEGDRTSNATGRELKSEKAAPAVDGVIPDPGGGERRMAVADGKDEK